MSEQSSPMNGKKQLSTISVWQQIRLKTYLLLEGEINTSFASKVVNVSLILLIITNVIAVILESEKSIMAIYSQKFLWFEYFSVAIFTVEYLLRFWASIEDKRFQESPPLSARIRYFFSPMALIDLIAILPIIISIFFTIDLRVLRLIRILRLLKLTHYFKGFNIFVSVLVKEVQSITIAFMAMIFLIIIAASLMHSVEGDVQPEVFGSIIQAFWWAVVTMTTVGYGDVVPITTAGKIISTFIMLIGVAVVALPAGMLAARFGEELRERKKNLSVHIKEALANGEIDKREHEYLKNLADRLELQPEDLERSILLLEQSHQIYQENKSGAKLNDKQNIKQKVQHSAEKCPYCGK